MFNLSFIDIIHSKWKGLQISTPAVITEKLKPE